MHPESTSCSSGQSHMRSEALCMGLSAAQTQQEQPGSPPGLGGHPRPAGVQCSLRGHPYRNAGLSHPLVGLRPNTSMPLGHSCRAEGLQALPCSLQSTADQLDLLQQHRCPLAEGFGADSQTRDEITHQKASSGAPARHLLWAAVEGAGKINTSSCTRLLWLGG